MTQLKTDQNIERYLTAVETSMAMSDAQAQKHLEDEAKELRSLVHETTEQLEEDDRKEARLLHTAIDELRLQYALGTMESRERLEEIEERIENGVQHLKNAVGKAVVLSTKEKDAISNNLQSGWRRLKFQISLLYVRLDTAYEAGTKNLATGRDVVIKDFKLIRDVVKTNLGKASRKSTSCIKSIEKRLSNRTRRILDAMDCWFEDR